MTDNTNATQDSERDQPGSPGPRGPSLPTWRQAFDRAMHYSEVYGLKYRVWVRADGFWTYGSIRRDLSGLRWIR